MRRLHPSWLIAALAGGGLLGVSLSGIRPLALTGWAWLFAAGVFTVIGFAARTNASVLLLLAAGFILGTGRGVGLSQNLSGYHPLLGQTVGLTGKVAADPVLDPAGNQRLQIGQVSLNGQVLPGKVWASLRSPLQIKRGDFLAVTGRLGQGFGAFTASLYNASLTRAARPVPGDFTARARDRLVAGINRAIPQPEASLGAGFLLGTRAGLPSELNDQWRLLGLVHILVASGYHLTVVAGLVRRYLGRISKYQAVLGSALVIIFFLLLTGFSASMTRAAIVAGLSLLAWYYGRNIHPAVLLLVAAGISAWIDPLAVWADVGWALSFSAFAGVIILAPLIRQYFWGGQAGGTWQTLVATAIGAQIATLPITMAAFGQLSPLSLVANLLVLPLVPLAMLLTLVAGLGGLWGFGGWIGWPAWALLRYMTIVADYLSGLPWASVKLSLSAAGLVYGYLAIAAGGLTLWCKTGLRFRNRGQIS